MIKENQNFWMIAPNYEDWNRYKENGARLVHLSPSKNGYLVQVKLWGMGSSLHTVAECRDKDLSFEVGEYYAKNFEEKEREALIW